MALERRSPRVSRMNETEKGVAMRNLFKYGGIAASVVLIVFGAVSIGLGAWGINNVRDNLKLEQISGSPDMTPSAMRRAIRLRTRRRPQRIRRPGSRSKTAFATSG